MKSTMSWFCLFCAAQTGSLFAQTGVDAYRLGNYEQALPLLQNESNVPLSHYYLGRLYLYGYGVPKDKANALKEFQIAAEKGVLLAQQFMGRYALVEENNPEQALYWFKKAADAGDVDAQMYCASAYIFGFGVSKNPDLAKRYYIPAARSGNAKAQYAVAESFLETRQLANKKLGLLWLTKAVAQEHPAAQVMLAQLYLTGGVVEKNDEQAHALLVAACAQNFVPAWIAMSEYSAQNKAYESAKEWMMKGAMQHDPASEMGVALLYADEKSPLYNAHESFLWMLKAAQNGYVPAQLALAKQYQTGQGIEVNPTLATQWTTQAKNAYKTENRMQKVIQWLTDHRASKWSDTIYQLKGIVHDWTNSSALHEQQKNAAPHMVDVSRALIFQPAFVMLRPNQIAISDYYQALVGALPAQDARTSIDFPQEIKFLTGPVSTQDASPRSAFIFNEGMPWYATNADVVRGDANIVPSSWLDYLTQRAILGDSDAQYELGQRYQYGLGTSPDRDQALHYYRMATVQHDLRAQYQGSVLLLQNPQSDAERQAGIMGLSEAAFKGHPLSQYVLAQLHEQGYENGAIHWRQNTEQAMALYELAALNHNGPAQYRLAEILVRATPQDRSVAGLKKRHDLIQQLYAGAVQGGVVQAKLPLAYFEAMDDDLSLRQQAFVLATTLAQAGDPHAALLLGMMYDRGLSVTPDAMKAYAWYQKASQTPVSTFILGTYLTQGHVTAERLTVGQLLLQKSANAGFMYASYNLAILKQQRHEDFIPDLEKAMQRGQSSAGILLADYAVSQDLSGEKLQQARQIYQKLAEQGDPNSQLKLAYLCEQGLGGPQDPSAAEQWYLAAANQGQAQAQYLLGRWYQLGSATQEPDPLTAQQWYAKAAAQYAPASVATGFMAETMRDDDAQARVAYQNAANLGDPVGQYDLGLLYEQGKGVPFNITKALTLYQQAAAQGYAPAASRVTALAALQK